LTKPKDDFKSAFPGLGFRNLFSFRTAGERVLLVDPTYLADVYNAKDEIAAYVRVHGRFLMDFGGDTAAPVWWTPPFLVIPLSIHLSEQGVQAPKGTKILADEIGTDSGSFVFLPLARNLPGALRKSIKKLLVEQNAVELKLPAGKWTAYYEQFEARAKNMQPFYRNIVLSHSAVG